MLPGIDASLPTKGLRPGISPASPTTCCPPTGSARSTLSAARSRQPDAGLQRDSSRSARGGNLAHGRDAGRVASEGGHVAGRTGSLAADEPVTGLRARGTPVGTAGVRFQPWSDQKWHDVAPPGGGPEPGSRRRRPLSPAVAPWLRMPISAAPSLSCWLGGGLGGGGQYVQTDGHCRRPGASLRGQPPARDRSDQSKARCTRAITSPPPLRRPHRSPEHRRSDDRMIGPVHVGGCAPRHNEKGQLWPVPGRQ